MRGVIRMATTIAYPYGIVNSQGRIIEKFESIDNAERILSELRQMQSNIKNKPDYFKYKHSYIFTEDNLKIVKVPSVWAQTKIIF